MNNTLTRITIGICLLYGMLSNSMASSIEVSGSYNGTYTWDVDTVYITGDCDYDSLFVAPGTFVQFLSDFYFRATWMEAKGTNTDSITFAGNLSPDGEPFGRISSGTCIKCSPGPSQISSVRSIGLNKVNLYITSHSRFINCDTIYASYSEYNTFENNNCIFFSLFLKECRVIRNKNLFYAPDYYLYHGIDIFECEGNYFAGNQTGMHYSGRYNNDRISFRNNIFIENSGTAISYNKPFNMMGEGYYSSIGVYYNKFIRNNGDILDFTGEGNIISIEIGTNEFIGNTGLPVEIDVASDQVISGNLFENNLVPDGPGAIYSYSKGMSGKKWISNNTFVNNHGDSSGSIEIFIDGQTKTNLRNNVFWNNTASVSDYEIKLEVPVDYYPPGYDFEIKNSVFKDTTKIVSYNDTLSDLRLVIDSIYTNYPEFVDTVNDNFRFTSYSPYIDMGSGSPEGTDLDGNPRVFGSAVDIGAYEYIPTCYPEILYQSGDTNLFTGDTLRLKIQTNDSYDYSWFLNNAILAGEKDSCLVVDSVVLADTGEYKVRISNLTDTIWSAPMNIRVYPFTSALLLPDSLYLCPDSIEISIDIEGINFLWSTGDTTSSITVNKTGTYWVQLTDSLGLYLNDTVVVYRPSSIEISGLYKGFDYEFCADTLLVVGNCEFRAIKLKPGTFILFKGDYTIELRWLESFGTETDSITFCGSLTDTIKQGRLFDYSFNIWQEPPSFLSLTNLVNLKSVDVTYVEKCSLLNCHSVHIIRSTSNKVLRNDIVYFGRSIDSCQVVENKLLRFLFYYDRWISNQYYFDCTNSTFLRNSSGLNTGGRGILHIENCRFIENVGPVVNYPVYSIDKYEIPSVSIRYNTFYKNIGNILVFDFMDPEYSYVGITNNEFIENEGIAVFCNEPEYLTVSNNLFVKNRTSSGPGSIYYYNSGKDKPVTIKNNTFVGNLGETFGCIEIISDTTCPINTIANNIFWENSATLSEYVVGIDFINTPSEVCEMNLTNSVAKDTGKIAMISGAGFELAQKNSFDLYPEFVDSLNNNFRLKSYSPYIDMGTGSAGDSDLDGKDRIYGKAIDIGAYEFIPVSIPELFSQCSDTLLCTGDSVLLSAETNDFCVYQWYVDGERIENANRNLFYAKCPEDDSIMFQLRVSGLNDTLWTDTITISKAEPPVTALPEDSLEVCMHEDTSITIDYLSPLPVSIQWFSQLQGKLPETDDAIELFNVVENDKLHAIIENTCGTDTSGIINLTVLELPVTDLGRDTAIHANEKILLNAGPGYPHYLWNDNSIGQYRVAYAGDTVWCLVTDEAGCSGSDTIIIALDPLNVKSVDGENLQVKIYPVPAVDVLTVELPGEIELPCTLSIYTLSGELIKQIESNSVITTIPVHDLTNANMYFLKIRTDSFTGTWRFLVN